LVHGAVWCGAVCVCVYVWRVYAFFVYALFFCLGFN